MLNRNDAIEMYVTDMDLISLVNALNSWDGSFENCQWYDMDELDDFLSGSTPTEILNMGWFGSKSGFNPNRDYFKFDAYENLVSGWDVDVVADIEDSLPDIIDYLQRQDVGHTDDDTLDAIIEADDTAMFDEETFEQVEEE
ncbi:hypothetical protein [Allisonella histaminiformans]|uniref:hypothetical protein n=1 Tax=Allisonella histaminiformans TaxID=209880 RepID=UPI0029424CB5|nr:hypothetical protein [Allisonella histaminiformans]